MLPSSEVTVIVALLDREKATKVQSILEKQDEKGHRLLRVSISEVRSQHGRQTRVKSREAPPEQGADHIHLRGRPAGHGARSRGQQGAGLSDDDKKLKDIMSVKAVSFPPHLK
ncbi:MAG TPA: hypothetical protein VMK12_28310 [Anaeromyxobacteraceae bacterium]|nr:hypothetical protein [Anaeromyxobacteraceae bacterium]